jgi:signal peptide peptidase SppA
MLHNLHKLATNETWLMQPAAHATMMKVIERMEDAPKRYAEICGEAVELPSMRIENGTAIIPINGVMVRGVSMAEKIGGVVCMEDIERDVIYAMESPEVERVVLDIDSPGGMYNGTPELAEVVAKCKERKPMAAFTAGTMASAAYYVGSATGNVMSTSSASTGSIGVVLMWPDVSKAMEDEGIKIKVFSSGEYKGMTPEVELTDKQSEYMQQRVMSLADDFYSHVMGQRAGVNAAAFDGRVFMAKEALELGLIDGTARNVNEVIEMMNASEEIQALKATVNQLREELKEARAEITALTDLVTEQASSKEPEPEAQEEQPDINAIVEQAVAEKMAELKNETKANAAQEVSKIIASAGQAGPIPEAQTKPTSELTGLERAIAAHKQAQR